MRGAKVLLAAQLLSTAATWSPGAKGQVVPNRATDGSAIAVTLRASEPARIRLELYDPNERPPRDLPSAVCLDRCGITALPGRYLLRVSGPPGSDVHASKRFFDLTDTSVVTIDPPSSFARYAGLGLGVVGPVLVLGGLFLAVNSADLTGKHEQPYYTLGIASIVGGLVATPVGWIMFGANGTPGIDVRAIERRPIRPR